MQRPGQVDSRLSTESNDHPFRLFQVENVHDVLCTERFKIQLVRTGIVSGDRFRVVVDNDCFIACLPDRADRMHRGIVKLHALADTDRPGNQHNYFFPIRNYGFVLYFVRRIEVWNVAVKLRRAGVDHLIDRKNAAGFPHVKDFLFTHMPELTDLSI